MQGAMARCRVLSAALAVNLAAAAMLFSLLSIGMAIGDDGTAAPAAVDEPDIALVQGC
jgi:hypothetical protein